MTDPTESVTVHGAPPPARDATIVTLHNRGTNPQGFSGYFADGGAYPSTGAARNDAEAVSRIVVPGNDSVRVPAWYVDLIAKRTPKTFALGVLIVQRPGEPAPRGTSKLHAALDESRARVAELEAQLAAASRTVVKPEPAPAAAKK